MIEMLKIAICEDTKEEEEKLTSILKEVNTANEYQIFHSGEEFLELFQPHEYDLLLMDIYMEGISGIETVEKVRETDSDVAVAFVTTSQDFALQSYRLSALKYIEKPYQKKDIEEILQLAKIKKESVPKLIIYKNGKEERIIFRNILYIEAQGRHLMIHLKTGEAIQITEKLTSLLPQLENQPFFHSHKSYCVNLEYIMYIDQELKCFVLENNVNIPIRRESFTEAKKEFEKYIFNKTRGIS